MRPPAEWFPHTPYLKPTGKLNSSSSRGAPLDFPNTLANVYKASAPDYIEVAADVVSPDKYARYQPVKEGNTVKSTYCNIAAWDVITALGGEFPYRYRSSRDGEIKARNANSLAKEFNSKAVLDLGWTTVTTIKRDDALAVGVDFASLAQRGYISGVLTYNRNGAGHVSVFLPRPPEGTKTWHVQAGTFCHRAFLTDWYAAKKFSFAVFFYCKPFGYSAGTKGTRHEL